MKYLIIYGLYSVLTRISRINKESSYITIPTIWGACAALSAKFFPNDTERKKQATRTTCTRHLNFKLVLHLSVNELHRDSFSTDLPCLRRTMSMLELVEVDRVSRRLPTLLWSHMEIHRLHHLQNFLISRVRSAIMSCYPTIVTIHA